jgi:hypothetical protein
VTEEVSFALARKGGDDSALPAIVPIPIEGPPIVPPPAELKASSLQRRVSVPQQRERLSALPERHREGVRVYRRPRQQRTPT